ncbi:hypothetical protein ID810_11295 [Actinomyces respiraculi]|uniref:Uncharacterized protein n=1 Tax=Actinomyces respiraculi TaxID=2744574 RepID=A0A7T0PWX1_9ACTO|nr:hypothetical protein ID810_11295 [Actinomyces respiraculi]
MTMARARSLEGPWETCLAIPILTHRPTDHPVQVTGHADLVPLDADAEHPDGDWDGRLRRRRSGADVDPRTEVRITL